MQICKTFDDYDYNWEIYEKIFKRMKSKALLLRNNALSVEKSDTLQETCPNMLR